MNAILIFDFGFFMFKINYYNVYFIFWKYSLKKIFILFLTIFQSFLFSTTFYVSTTGTDNSTCTQSNPCEHIQTAIDLTVDGDIVRVLVGTYYENIFIRTAISLLSDDPLNPAIIDGSAPDNADWASCI